MDITQLVKFGTLAGQDSFLGVSGGNHFGPEIIVPTVLTADVVGTVTRSRSWLFFTL